ncbi:hypothetical protein H5P36_23795 [Bacillus sp. APMAM]|nr:hypothetical protein [Bacillus sp. APMAM]RTZ53387.1 hypothetical protein EKO25_23565 [Bacillus sp. SAJ1]
MNNEKSTLELNKKIYDFWQQDFMQTKQPEDYHFYLPGFLNELHKSKLTIIGCNPSLNKDGYKSCFRGTPYENINFISKISRAENRRFSENLSFNIKEIQEIEKYIGIKHPYVGKLRKIAKDIGIHDFENDVTVLDLFFFRDTNQKNIMKRIKQRIPKTRPVQYILSTFALKQIKIAMEALVISNPDIIFIPNAFASNIFIEYNQDKITSKQIDDLKFYAFKLNGKCIPIFFSSMLSGQRALDTFSLERLVWDMSKVLGKIRNNVFQINQ